MAKTTSNQTRAIVTLSSDHTAKTDGKTDTCIKPDMTPDSWENNAYSFLLTANRTNNTFIENVNVCKEDTYIGPLSFPLHPGILGGVKSGTFWLEATSTSCSNDCFMEGKGVVRTDDTTDQNHGNTSGKVNEGIIVPSAESANQYAERVCQIAKFEGVDSFTGRKLGFFGKAEGDKPNHLDVFTQSTINFTTERRDITNANAEVNPACPKGGKHTSWMASCKVFPSYLHSREKPGNGEQFTVESNMAVQEFLLMLGGMVKGDDPKMEDGQEQGGSPDYKQEWSGDREKEWFDGQQKAAGDRTAGIYKDKTGKDTAPPKGRPQPLNAGNVPLGGEGNQLKLDMSPANIKRMIMFFWWAVNPPEIKVAASACAGAREATLRVFPYQNLKIDLPLEVPGAKRAAKKFYDKMGRSASQRENAQEREQRIAQNQMGEAQRQQQINQNKLKKINPNDQQNRRHFQNKIDEARKEEEKAMARFDKAANHFDMIVSTFNTIKKILSTAEDIAKCAGEPLRIEFLEGFGLEITISYQPCEGKTGFFGRPYYSTAQIWQKWEIRAEAEPLLGVHYRRYFSILNLLLPFAGEFVAKLLRRFRVVRLDIFFGVGFGVNLNAGVQKDQHDFPSLTAPQIQFSLNLSAGAVGGVAGIEIQFTARIPSSVTFEFQKPTKPGSMLEMGISAEIGCHFSVVCFPDRFLEFEAWADSPKSLQFSWKKAEPIVLLRTPS